MRLLDQRDTRRPIVVVVVVALLLGRLALALLGGGEEVCEAAGKADAQHAANGSRRGVAHRLARVARALDARRLDVRVVALVASAVLRARAHLRGKGT